MPIARGRRVLRYIIPVKEFEGYKWCLGDNQKIKKRSAVSATACVSAASLKLFSNHRRFQISVHSWKFIKWQREFIISIESRYIKYDSSLIISKRLRAINSQW